MAKILIVDDSSFSRRIIRQMLEPEGHEVLEAADGMTAIEQYFLHKPALVVLDLTMTGMHGLDVLAKLREMDAQARVIVATADIQSSSQALAEAGGALAYITKPFVAARVLQLVKEALQEVDHATD